MSVGQGRPVQREMTRKHADKVFHLYRSNRPLVDKLLASSTTTTLNFNSTNTHEYPEPKSGIPTPPGLGSHEQMKSLQTYQR